ncbi:MAG: NADP(H)-dependent aldo-keto reductase [Alphaproteobacteria bacterium]|nr:NADP(H)-dependent aldo-keto reductase [Alphaproteobacteria bacterium]RCL82765.1 MAG: NADP(H)-dependent aldo-keto reductase [Alphaproteobacteria bacterium]
MKKNNLGKTDIMVSEICLGTMTWGQQNSEKEAHDQLSFAIERGINFIDTAEMYSVPPKEETYGLTEKYIGTWLKNQDRSKIILATKIAGRTSNVPSGPPGLDWIRKGPRLNEEHIFEAIENSLKRLNTEYIDLYQIHWPERPVNSFGQLGYIHNPREDDIKIEVTLEALSKAVQKGLIKYIGLSNETPWGVMKFIEAAKEFSLPRVVSIQNPYSLLNRSFEAGLSEIAINEEVGLLPYSPLAGGVLSGKYLNGKKPENARMTLFERMRTRYTNQHAENAVLEYQKIALKYDLNLTQMAINFVTKQNFVTSNIIGATSIDQLEENIDSINCELNEEVIKEIEKVHKIYTYPCP